jgi:hypothetical protein
MMGETLMDKKISASIEKEYGVKILGQLEEYVDERFLKYLSRQQNHPHIELRKLILDKNKKGLDAFLESDDGRKFPIRRLTLLEFFSSLILSKPENLDISKFGMFDKKRMEFLIDRMKQKDQSLQVDQQPGIQKSSILDSLRNELSKLIKGYNIYLKKFATGDYSVVAICDELETVTFKNKIINIRQEFQRYDKYYNGFHKICNPTKHLTDYTKYHLLKVCLQKARNPSAF